MKYPQLIIQTPAVVHNYTEIRVVTGWTPYAYTVWGVACEAVYGYNYKSGYGPWRLSEGSLRHWICITPNDLLLYMTLPNKSPLFDKILSGEYKLCPTSS